MAGISTISYCTDQDIHDIYPRISSTDLKFRIYNWTIDGHIGTAVNTGLITVLFADGKDLGNAQANSGAVDSVGDWYYDSNLDKVFYYFGSSNTNPNNMIMESGDDFATTQLRFRRKASRIIESFLGSTISREIMKDREGNYPTSIVQATALKTAILFISAHNPNNPDLIPLNDEYDDIMGKIRSGKIIMTGHRSSDDSKGKIRIVEEGSSQHEVYPVELSGSYKGNEYELLKVAVKGSLYASFRDKSLSETDGTCSINPLNPPIDTTWYDSLYTESECTANGGVWLTDRKDNHLDLYYSVWGKSSNKLKETLLVDNELVSGDFQTLGVSDLRIRWGFSEWKAESGDVLMGLKPFKIPYGYYGVPVNDPDDIGEEQYEFRQSQAVFYTGEDGASVGDLYDEGLLPNLTGIIAAGEAATLNPTYGWVGTLDTLNNNDDNGLKPHLVTTSAAQDEIMYKDGSSIWSWYGEPAEYEIELWGYSIQPTVSQINSISMTKRSELWQ